MSLQLSIYDAVLATASGNLAYQVRHTRRRTLGLYVHADGRVEVRVPPRCEPGVVADFVAGRQEWIRRKQAEFAARPRPATPGYGDGEPHPYLGRNYPLRLRPGGPSRVRLEAGQLCVDAHDVDQPGRVAHRLQQWYREQARVLFPARLAMRCEAMADYRIRWPDLKIRHMKTRWGSCSRHGSVTLNLELIKFPLPCLDYVIAHELCHLLEFNHSPRFYALMDSVMPEWRKRRARLNESAPARDVG